MKLVITDAKRFHCGQIARTMRVDHEASLRVMGVSIHRELRRVFGLSYYRRCAHLDGHLVALWGMEGSMMSSSGKVWLVLSQYALRFPKLILGHARLEIENMALGKSELFTTVIPDDEPAQRLVAHLGFESPDGFGEGPARTVRARGRLVRHLNGNPDLMVEAGTARQVAVVWRKDRQESPDGV